MGSGSRKVSTSSVPSRGHGAALVDNYIARQKRLGLLRFIACGSAGDGKSTLIGRMLWEARQINDDQVGALESNSRKHGAQGDGLDFALLVDGIAAEREQGTTIDVAYRFFSTGNRKFIVADAPGHDQYTRNLVTGASTAEVAVLLVDARSGVQTQTRRHAYLVALMGIRHVVLAVNKMDLVNFERDVFEGIRQSFGMFAQELGFREIVAIPISALRGDNVLHRSPHTHWYGGPTLFGYLEAVEVKKASAQPMLFPVQWVSSTDQELRGYAGTVAEGEVKVGQDVRVTASGQVAKVARIATFEGDLPRAVEGQAVTLALDREVDISRGDVLSLAQNPLNVTDHFEATLVWMSEEQGLRGRTYELRLATQWTAASITSIEYRVNMDTFAHEAHKVLGLNDVCVCKLSTNKPIVFDTFSNSATLGSFILVDRLSYATVGAGIIRHSLRRAQNVHRQALAIGRADREKLNGHKGMVLWFTGYSGAGKSTIASALEVALHADGRRTYILDGDNMRHGLNKDLGFTDADRVENIRRVAEVAKLMVDAGLIVITSFISPFRSERDFARSLFEEGRFVEVFVDTPLEVCESRDPKGLYKKARSGLLPNMTGIGSAYEAPLAPEIRLDAAKDSIEGCAEQIKKFLLSVMGDSIFGAGPSSSSRLP